MLPDDVRACKAATIATNAMQSTLDDHIMEIQSGEQVEPYSDKLFHAAAVKWLICTNQVSHFIFSELKHSLVL